MNTEHRFRKTARIGSQAISLALVVLVMLSAVTGSAVAQEQPPGPNTSEVKWSDSIDSNFEVMDTEVTDSSVYVYAFDQTGGESRLVKFSHDGSRVFTQTYTRPKSDRYGVVRDSLTVTDNGRVYISYTPSDQIPTISEVDTSTGSITNTQEVTTNSHNRANIVIDSYGSDIEIGYWDAGQTYVMETHDESLTQQGTATVVSSSAAPQDPYPDQYINIEATSSGAYISVLEPYNEQRILNIYDSSGGDYMGGPSVGDYGVTLTDMKIAPSGDIFMSIEGDQVDSGEGGLTKWSSGYPDSPDLQYSSVDGRMSLFNDTLTSEQYFFDLSLNQVANVDYLSGVGNPDYTTSAGDNYFSYSGNQVYMWGEATENFQVERLSDNEPLEYGNTYSVDVNVTNSGPVQGTQTVSLDVNGNQVDSNSVTLNPGEETITTLTWQTSQSDIGTNSATISSGDDSVSYDIEVLNPVQSIDLTISDQTIINGESSSYSVSGTDKDGTTSDVTGSSSVSADDTSVVSVDSANTEIDYQGDGTTVVRASYTNSSGTVLWDNETVETDTPEIQLTVNENPIPIDERANYSVTQTLFGSTTDVTGSATVSSDTSSVVTVQQSNSTYKGVSIGFANLTADVSVSGDTYSDEVEVEVLEPQAITWDNWEYLTGGEKMILMFSDWSILYMFASLVVSTMIAIKLKAPRVGVASFGLLIGAGWIIGFVPNYVALTLLVFSIFTAFLFEFQIQPSQS